MSRCAISNICLSKSKVKVTLQDPIPTMFSTVPKTDFLATFMLFSASASNLDLSKILWVGNELNCRSVAASSYMSSNNGQV